MAMGRRRRPGVSSLRFTAGRRFLGWSLPLDFFRRRCSQNPRQPAEPVCFAGEAPGTDFSGVTVGGFGEGGEEVFRGCERGSFSPLQPQWEPSQWNIENEQDYRHVPASRRKPEPEPIRERNL
jgi:hypothetical protein